MLKNSQEIRKSFLEKWNKNLLKHFNTLDSDFVSGSSPTSIFLGTYNYPKIFIGPMVPPFHGDTGMLDNPEGWADKKLEEIINYRLNLIRGVKKVSVYETENRYIEDLQEITMSSKPTDVDLQFTKIPSLQISNDVESIPSGLTGHIKLAKFGNSYSTRAIEKKFYDRDVSASDSIFDLYRDGVEISKIQKCLSVGMLGKERKLVPTKWSITATDDIISKLITVEILDYPLLDSVRVYSYCHLGNQYVVILFPHRWVFEMIEAWYSNGTLGMGSDYEDTRGIKHYPSIAGAFFAAKLGVVEYLSKIRSQSGALILREISPEYSIPVGVWQIREGIRLAMKQVPEIVATLENGLDLAFKKTKTKKFDWLSKSNMKRIISQKTISEFL